MTDIDIVYWLDGFSQPQRKFTPSMIPSRMEIYTQATLVEDYFSNLVNECGTIVMSNFQKLMI
jgi:hypothetical protein